MEITALILKSTLIDNLNIIMNESSKISYTKENLFWNISQLLHTHCTLSCWMNCVAYRGALPGAATAFPQ